MYSTYTPGIYQTINNNIELKKTQILQTLLLNNNG